MTKIIKLALISVIIGASLGTASIIFAEEPQTPQLSSEVILDEKISAEDLGVKDQKVLPDSPFYFLKEWARKIEITFTFNKVKKIELENKYANEKLVELKKLVEKNADSGTIEKATENYKNATEKVKEKADKIEEKAEGNKGVDKFLDKFVKQQVLQEKILQKLEDQVPQEVFEKIQEAREQHLEKFGEVMTKLEDRNEKIQEKVENALKTEGGSQFNDFKNLEILKNIEEKISEKAKEAIQQVQENSLKKLGNDLEKMSAENQEKFKEYIKGISGDKEKQLEILESIKTEVQEKPKLEEKLNEVREKILEKVENKLLLREVCPVIDKPLPDFCEKGRIVIEKDKNECISAFRCVMPTETEISSECEPICKGIGTKSEGWYNPCTSGLIKYANCGGENSDNPNPEICTTLWDPVCGEDNKTYSNKCSAKLAGVGIVYAGECKKAGCDNDSDCPQVKCGATNVVKCPGAIMKCINGTCTRISTPVKTAE